MLEDDLTTEKLSQRAQTQLDGAETRLDGSSRSPNWQAEARSRALISHLPSGAAFVVDRDLRYVLAEGEALATAGFKPEDFIGQTIFEVLPSDLVALYEPMYRQALAGEPFEHEHQAHEHTYISRGTPLWAESGEIDAVLVVSYDISERKRAEVALRESEARLQSIANLVPDLLWDSKPDGSTNWYNQRWMEYTGQTFEQAIGWGWTDAIHPDDREGLAQRYREAVEQGMSLQQEHRIRRHDGAYRWFVVKASPLKDESGKVIKMYGAATDIHEQRVALEALRESEAKYRSLFESIDEGFAIVEVFPDEHGRVADMIWHEANHGVERHAGMGGWVGKRASEIVPNLEQGWLDAMTGVYQTGEPVRMEAYIADLDRWIDTYYARVGGAGSPLIAAVFNDITDRKRREEHQEFILKLSDALRPLSDPVAIQDAAMQILGEYLGVNRAFYGDVLEDENTIVFSPGYANEVFSLPRQMKFSDFDPEMMSVYRAGQTIVLNNVQGDAQLTATAKAVFDAILVRAAVGVPLVKNGKVRAIMSIHQAAPRQWTKAEISLLEETAERIWSAVERARAEVALRESELQRVREQSEREQERQRAETLAELDRAKTLFFGNVSHEFRTPLTLLLAPLQDALSDPTLDPIHREQLELARRNSLRLLKLVNTLLDFSRIEAGRIEAIYEPTDLAAFTIDLASVFRSAIERSGLRLLVQCPPLPAPVYVDREMWEKIVLNLLSNAFKFTFEGEITVSLRAESSTERHPSPSNTRPLTSESQRPSSELETSTSELETSTSNPQTSTSELETSTSELETSSSKLETLTSELETLTSELETSTLKPETSSSEPQTSPFPARAILEIRDTGTGIAPKHLPHLFERFYQIRGTKARTHEGSGIGLALVHELVRLQGGTIAVSSTVGQGTCFTITLPFGTDRLPPECIHATRTSASTALGADPYIEEAERWLPKDSAPSFPLRRGENSAKIFLEKGDLKGSPALQVGANSSAHVLIVDDNADIRDYLTRILSEYVRVEAVSDGTAALAAIQAQVPDLVLSDVMMPGLNGFSLLQALRTNPRTREIPIILLSARAGQEAIVEGLTAGADDYLIKPFSAQELVSRVNAHLQLAQLRGEALHEARATIRRKDELLSTVSHELNTPLVSILGWTRLMRSNPPNPPMLAKALDTIERNATLQAKLVHDLLDITRITIGKLRLNPQPVRLEPIIETAIATVHHLAEAKGIDLVWSGITNRPPNHHDVGVVMGDRDRLGQVFSNLLTNAIKFTPEAGRITVELLVSDRDTSGDAAYAQIQIIDTGIGIAADFLPYVFQSFRQARDADAAQGLGLGLAIAQHLVELHHGTIHAYSAGNDQGTTFIVRLPLLTPHPS